MKPFWKKRPGTDTLLPAESGLAAPAATGVTAGFECKVYSISETGPTRSSNEDAVCSSYPAGSYGCLFAMVADGMGGHNAGEVASSLACEVMTRWVQQHRGAPDAAAMLSRGIEAAHRTIRQEAERAEDRKGMGTTATALFIRSGLLHYTHVGDSRLYQLSGEDWRQLSTDHTLVGQLVQNGELRAEDAGNHPMKNYITQAVGYTKDIAPQSSPAGGIPLSTGDRCLLVSDGVYDVLSSDELGALAALASPGLALECIRALCTERKSSDNFSAVLVTVSDDLRPPLSITKEQNAAL